MSITGLGTEEAPMCIYFYGNMIIFLPFLKYYEFINEDSDFYITY